MRLHLHIQSTLIAATEPTMSQAAALALEIPSKQLATHEFHLLNRRLFSHHSIVAVVGVGAGSRSAEACRGIAAGLAAAGHRVVTVQTDVFLRWTPFPPVTATLPGHVPETWLWPAPPQSPDLYQAQPKHYDWLTALRREFDAVVIDCLGRQSNPQAMDLAAMADSAVLVVESGITHKQQIQRDMRLLELRGVKLAGCILMQRR